MCRPRRWQSWCQPRRAPSWQSARVRQQPTRGGGHVRPKRRGGAHPPLWSYGLKRRSCGPRTPALGAALRRSGSVQDMLACSGRASVSESVRPSSQPTAPQVTARRGGEGAKRFVGSGQRALEAGVRRGRLAFETAIAVFLFPKASFEYSRQRFTDHVCMCVGR